MDQNDHLKELAHIRGLMDRSTRFLSLSGLSGVFAGCVALSGAVLARYHINAAVGPARDVLTYGTGGSFTAEDALMKGWEYIGWLRCRACVKACRDQGVRGSRRVCRPRPGR